MYYRYFVGKFLALALPRRISYFLIKVIALAKFYFSRKDRRDITYNLTPVIKDKRILQKCARRSLVNFSYYLVDFVRYSKLNRNFVEKYVKVDGLENVNQCLAQHKGVILAAAHLGNYELGGAVTALLGYPLCVVALPHQDARVNKFFDTQRKTVRLEVIATGTGIRGCFDALKSNKIIALLGDKDFAGKGLKTKMFSRYAYIPRGIAFFAFKTAAPIVPAFFIRENKFFYRLIFEKPVPYDKNKDGEQAILDRYTLVLEKYIKKYPDQWYMFEKYWLPENEQ